MFKVLQQLVSVTGAVTYLFISVSMILPPILCSLVALCFRFVQICLDLCACVRACLSVCPLAYLRNYVSNLYRILCMSLITENRFFYLLALRGQYGLYTATYIHTDPPGAKSDIYDCFVMLLL